MRVEAETDRLQRECDEWMEGVQVDELAQGYQAFYRLLHNEVYEQGHGIGEFLFNDKGNDVERLVVADSKGTYFHRASTGAPLETYYSPPGPDRSRRGDGTDNVERVLRNSYRSAGNMVQYLQGRGYRKIDTGNMIYSSYDAEAGKPYGVSLMRSTEFDAKVLLTIKNSLHRTWERFGDPIFVATLKKKVKRSGVGGMEFSQSTLDEQANAIAGRLADAMTAKKNGNSADVVNAIGPDDDLSIEVLGADDKVLEVEMPARHLLENVVAKTGLPSWMLGFHWSTAERLAGRQSEIVLQESRTRFELRRPALKRPIEAMLRARGITFKPEDWQLAQDLPNLQDLEAQGRARLYNAQAEALENGADLNINRGRRAGDTDPNNDDDGKAYTLRQPEPVEAHKDHDRHTHKVETYVEDEAALMRLERRAERDLLKRWADLQDDVLAVLGVDNTKTTKQHEPVFVFDPALMQQKLRELQDEFIAAAGAENAELARAMFDAWQRGVMNGAAEFTNPAEVTEAVRSRINNELSFNALNQVRVTTIRALGQDLIAALQQGAYNGLNPKEVARQLAKQFDVHNYDWQRLARSEIAEAQVRGKESQYLAEGVTQYNWIRAGGACPICVDKEQGSPYPVGAGPLPMRDSHPNCRCTIGAAVVDDQNG